MSTNYPAPTKWASQCLAANQDLQRNKKSAHDGKKNASMETRKRWWKSSVSCWKCWWLRWRAVWLVLEDTTDDKTGDYNPINSKGRKGPVNCEKTSSNLTCAYSWSSQKEEEWRAVCVWGGWLIVLLGYKHLLTDQRSTKYTNKKKNTPNTPRHIITKLLEDQRVKRKTWNQPEQKHNPVCGKEKMWGRQGFRLHRCQQEDNGDGL